MTNKVENVGFAYPVIFNSALISFTVLAFSGYNKEAWNQQRICMCTHIPEMTATLLCGQSDVLPVTPSGVIPERPLSEVISGPCLRPT